MRRTARNLDVAGDLWSHKRSRTRAPSDSEIWVSEFSIGLSSPIQQLPLERSPGLHTIRPTFRA